MVDDRFWISEALRVLGIRNLVLGIQDPSFPSLEDEDTGRGSPYSEGGRRFLRFVHELGFNGVQLGPQGQTSESNPSPYDGTIFSRNTLSIALKSLVSGERWGGLLRPESLSTIVSAKPSGAVCKAQHRYVFQAQRDALWEAFFAFFARRGRDTASAVRGTVGVEGKPLETMEREFDTFCRHHRDWLENDALYEALSGEYGGLHWRDWRGTDESDLDQRLLCPRPGEEAASAKRRERIGTKHAERIKFYAFCQWLVHEQHTELRALTSSLGLKLYGDLQIGLSERDIWSYQSLFLKGYCMGAPPSRTNPEGQPWNYGVFDPAYFLLDQSVVEAQNEKAARAFAQASDRALGPVLKLLSARVDKLFSEFDGLRVDHPHGLVCPWVYKAEEPDALWAVKNGARLFSSPDLPDHPELTRLSIATAAQINRDALRYADDWVLSLTPEQVRRYGTLFDVLVTSARKNGRDIADLVCEVLSTMPYPLKCVLKLHGLGRFRVTQKADLENPSDVYRSENAEPKDWIMVGNHDTKPLWRLAREWQRSGASRRQAEYLASRLLPSEPRAREALITQLAAHPGKLAQAKLAELFTSRSENVMIFFSDLFGLEEVFNTPGTVSEDNWCLRVPNDYERDYKEKLGRDAALNLPRALSMAMRARGEDFASAHRELIERLEEQGKALLNAPLR